MANEMGYQILEPTRDEPEGYKIISYKAFELPEEFRNLVIAPFLNSLRYGNDLFKLIDKDSYFANYTRYINSLLVRTSAVIRLAALSDNTILGWSLSEPGVVHYVWVKKEVRRQGIGRALLPKEFKKISHITNTGVNIWVNKYPEVNFDPFC